MKLGKAISRIVLSLELSFFSIVPLVNISYADFYSYVDRDGVRHYTNIPPTDNERYKLKWRAKKTFVKSNRIHKYSKSYEEEILRAAERYDIDPDLVKAIIKVESNFNSRLISRRGAVGIMQLMPNTADYYDVGNPFNPIENIDGGTKYLKKLMEMFAGDLNLTLAAYNAGENAVIKHGFRIPPYDETIDYVKKVLTHYKILKENVEVKIDR
jgi:soluble lytic murein transglycosylase-like protein